MAEILNRKGKVMSKLARRLFKKAIKNDFRLRQLSLLSAAFDDLQEEKILEVAPFSQIQASVLTARLLGQLSSNDFVTCNKALSKVANLPWSDAKKGYIVHGLHPEIDFKIPYTIPSFYECLRWWEG